MNQALRQELLALAEQEQSFLGSTQHDQNSDEVQRQLLALMGRLSRRLVEILDTHGWPGKTLVGEDDAEAAWTLALHTMHDPDVLRRCLTLMRDAAAAGEAEPSQVAFLVDRVSLVERNVQVYGTTICRQADGSFVRPCWRIPTGWMRAAGRSGFLRWKKLSAGSNSSTAAGRTARRRQARSGPLAQLAAATVVCWRVRRSTSRLSVQAVGGRAQAFRSADRRSGRRVHPAQSAVEPLRLPGADGRMPPVLAGRSVSSSCTARSVRWVNRSRSCSDSSAAIPTSTRHSCATERTTTAST
jgi:hypothetical protein